MSKAANFKIAEHPASNLLRFRYKKEGPHGSLIGENSTPDWTTSPAIEIENYTGIVSVRVSCVTKTKPYKSHPHDLIGHNCAEGVCYIDSFISEASSVLYFPGMSIQRQKREEIEVKLMKRQNQKIDPYKKGFKHIKELRKTLQCVRLCFEVFIRDPMNPTQKIRLPPKVTKPIYNTDIPAELKIYHISDTSSPKCGDKNIVILCNKISERNIGVRFFQKSGENVIWENYVTSLNVHRNVGISFMTPKYERQGQDRLIDVVENVFIQLVRPLDEVRSTAIPFHYIPSTSAQQYFPHYPQQPHQSELQPYQFFLENVPQHQPVQHQSVQHRPVQHRPVQHRRVQHRPHQRQEHLPQPVQHQLVHHQSVQYPLFQHQPVQHQPVQNESVQLQPIQNQPFQHQHQQQLHYEIPKNIELLVENNELLSDINDLLLDNNVPQEHLLPFTFHDIFEILQPSTVGEILQLPLLANGII